MAIPLPFPEPETAPEPKTKSGPVPAPKPKPESTPTPHRHVGAPLGNTNALKHGFYSRCFSPADLADLDTLGDNFDLQDEAGLMRIYIRRLAALAGASQTAEDASSLLRVLCMASLALNCLLRTRAVLSGGANRDHADLQVALSRLDYIMHWLNDFRRGRASEKDAAAATPSPHQEGDSQ